MSGIGKMYNEKNKELPDDTVYFSINDIRAEYIYTFNGKCNMCHTTFEGGIKKGVDIITDGESDNKMTTTCPVCGISGMLISSVRYGNFMEGQSLCMVNADWHRELVDKYAYAKEPVPTGISNVELQKENEILKKRLALFTEIARLYGEVLHD